MSSDLPAIPESVSALIPSGLDPKLTHGLALWFEGHSIHSAASLSGAAKSTLHRRIQALGDRDKEGRVKLVEEAMKLHAAIAQEAGRQLLERLVEQGDTMKTAELNFAYGTASDKTINGHRALQGDAGGAQAGLAALLEPIALGGSVTVSFDPNRTLDVTPRGDGE
jgi:hypothetical protein